LETLADECQLRKRIESLFNAEKINLSEDRAVPHITRREMPGEWILLMASTSYAWRMRCSTVCPDFRTSKP